jgi:RimJ/RimL family protein N-acetyltransferase
MLNAVEYAVRETLNDGTVVTIRAIRPDDRERIVAAFRGLEPRSIYTRFFHYKKDLSEQELRQLAQIDHMREVILVAVVGDGDEQIIVGSGHYAASGPRAEVAFAVEEDYQGRGLASRLLQHLVHIARENGVLRLEADVLAENAPMLAVLRHSGLVVTQARSDGLVHLTLHLDARPAST